MKNPNEKNIGCGQAFLGLCAFIFVVFILSSLVEGMSSNFDDIPWYLNVVLSIGLMYLIVQFYTKWYK